jgi:hypothetical protein
VATLFFALSMILLGHFIAALLVYLNHRFIFHGKLGRLPLIKHYTKFHTMHHAHAYDSKMEDHILVPWWGQIIMTLAIMSTGFIFGIWFALGVLSFSFLYMYEHWAIHHWDKTSKASVHHRIHHLKHPFKNYSGIYPFIDDIFGTTVKE